MFIGLASKTTVFRTGKSYMVSLPMEIAKQVLEKAKDRIVWMEPRDGELLVHTSPVRGGEPRRLQKGRYYVRITLPKAWAEKHGYKAGTVVAVEWDGRVLRIRRA